MYLITLLQNQDGAQTGGTAASITGTSDETTILHEVSSQLHVFILEACAELVGSVSRSNEFTVIGGAVVVNIAASDVGDDLVEFEDFVLTECCVTR